MIWGKIPLDPERIIDIRKKRGKGKILSGQVAAKKLEEGHDDQSGSFRPQDARTEPNGDKTSLLGLLGFLRGESSLRPHERINGREEAFKTLFKVRSFSFSQRKILADPGKAASASVKEQGG